MVKPLNEIGTELLVMVLRVCEVSIAGDNDSLTERDILGYGEIKSEL